MTIAVASIPASEEVGDLLHLLIKFVHLLPLSRVDMFRSAAACPQEFYTTALYTT